MTGWSKIRGHEHIKRYLGEALRDKSIFHAYLLSGEEGSGKKTIADTFAKSLVCESHGEQPCGICDACKKAEAKCHPDILYVSHEKPGSISVEEIRSQLIMPMSVKPYYGKYKIFIIDDGQLMTPQAQNALLKTLEEPPEYGVVLILTTNENMMLQTVLSRTVNLHCGEVSKDEVKRFLVEEYQISDYKAQMCAVFAQGNIGKAVAMATMEEFYSTKEAAVTLAKIIPGTEIFDLINRIKEISEYKTKIDKYLDFLFVWYHDVLMFKATKNIELCLFSDEVIDIQNQAELVSYEGLEEILNAVTNAKQRLKANVNFDLVMELLLMKIKECYIW